jgi:hypothetical protein
VHAERVSNSFGKDMICLAELLQVYYARRRKCFQEEEERWLAF